VIEGVELRGLGGNLVLSVGGGATVELAKGTIVEGQVHVAGGALSITDVSVANSLVTCMAGSVNVLTSAFAESALEATDCQVTILRSRFERRIDPIVGISGGIALIENNLFVQGYELADSLSIRAVAPSSHFWFNTVVNVSGVASDGIALFCDSLFDTVAADSHRQGVGNRVGDGATFFVDGIGADFHLSPQSPAIDGAEVGLPTAIDLEGRPRTAMPDIGAFEAP